MVSKYSQLSEEQKEKNRAAHRRWAEKNDRSTYYKEYEKIRPESSKEVRREYMRKYAEDNKERLAEYARNYSKSRTPEQRLEYEMRRSRLSVMLTAARNRAKRDELPFDIDKSDLEHDFICKCCGKQMQHNLGKGKTASRKDSPSVDKLIPSLGYVKGNVQIICHECNEYKRDQSIERVQLMIDYMKKYSPSV